MTSTQLTGSAVSCLLQATARPTAPAERDCVLQVREAAHERCQHGSDGWLSVAER